MSDQTEHGPESKAIPERLVGAYRDETTARQVAEEARAAGADRVEIEAEEDRIASLRGEMREEVSEAWAGPSVGIYTKEMARSVPKWTAAGTLVGLLIALPLALLTFHNLGLSTRLFAGACAGAFGGGAIGFLVGGGFFSVRRKAREQLAAEEGVVVGADVTDARVVDVMAERDPIRLDEVRLSGQPEETVVTEDQTESQSGPSRPS